MRIENSSQQSLSSRPDDTGTARHQESAPGMLQGAAVRVASDPSDPNGDSKEEISFEHSERVESHKLEEREIEDEPPLELPPINAILEYLETAAKENDPEERLKAFVAGLKRNAQQRQGEGESAKNGPREESRRQFGTVTEQFLALSFAAQELAREGGHETLLRESTGRSMS